LFYFFKAGRERKSPSIFEQVGRRNFPPPLSCLEPQPKQRLKIFQRVYLFYLIGGGAEMLKVKNRLRVMAAVGKNHSCGPP